MFSDVNYKNGRVNIIDQPKADSLFKLFDRNANHKTSFRDALKGVKQDNELSAHFFSKENIQIVQNGLRAGVYKMSNNKYVIGEQSYDNIKLIMQDAYYEHALNHPENIAQQISTGILQIENELYDIVRPKRSGPSGSRPATLLKKDGIEYLELRGIDINPFMPEGIDVNKIKLLDIYSEKTELDILYVNNCKR